MITLNNNLQPRLIQNKLPIQPIQLRRQTKSSPSGLLKSGRVIAQPIFHPVQTFQPVQPIYPQPVQPIYPQPVQPIYPQPIKNDTVCISNENFQNLLNLALKNCQN